MTIPLISTIVSNLNTIFALEDDLDEINFFLKIEPKHIGDDKNVLCQSKYVTDMLHKACMHSTKPMATLIVSNLKLSTYDSSPFLDPSLYMTIVGGFQYVTIIWCNVAFAVNKCN